MPAHSWLQERHLTGTLVDEFAFLAVARSRWETGTESSLTICFSSKTSYSANRFS